MKSKKVLFFSTIALFLLGIWSCALWPKNQPDDPRGSAYAGSAACMKCHKDIYQSYLSTAHYTSTSPSSVHNIHGSFAGGHNVFSFANKEQKVVMDKRDSGFYQTGYMDGKLIESRRFDITFGGVKAETYLYWQNNQLFELPISYFKAVHQWTNSPGFANVVNFGRPIVARCMECHSSYIHEVAQQTLVKTTVQYDKNTLIYGIDCERCHGPSAHHVDFHTDHPDEKKAQFITTFKSLTRAQKLDACAVCHSGNADKFQVSAFSFKMGDTLANFKALDFYPTKPNPDKLDVHGNQSGLLAASKCFLMSSMDCTTCHNTHLNDRGDVKLYSQKCMSCHNTQNHNTCSMAGKLSATLATNCVDCHMPVKQANSVIVQTESERGSLPYQVRTHRIAIYPEESKRIIAFIQQQQTVHKN